MARTKGAKNVTEFCLHHPTRCICGSTAREKYTARDVRDVGATTIGDGIPVTHVIVQLTKCADCGQSRHDISYENLPSGRVPPGTFEFQGDGNPSSTPATSGDRPTSKTAASAEPKPKPPKPGKQASPRPIKPKPESK